MRASIVITALVAVLVGFGGSVAIVLSAAKAVGATPVETSSWIAALCVSMMVTTAILSLRSRMPVITAWSTPGAALIAATSGIAMPEAVGAFFVAAALIVLTAASRPVARLIERIPTSIAAAMLAGVLFTFVIALLEHLQQSAALVMPLLIAFLVLRVFSPAWAVLAVLALGIALSYQLGLAAPVEGLSFSEFKWTTPAFDLTTIIGVGIPLYLVTMASQNLPGFAVLRAAGYAPQTRSILGVTGAASLLTAGFGAHTSNLAAITASICTGPESHPDPAKRWLCGPVYAAGYGVLALFGASIVAVFASFPEALVASIAGIALLGPLVGAIGTAFADDRQRFAAAVTFCVTASGIGAFGIGAAFWGLVAGLAVLMLERLRPQRPS
jgi:benzoate membrane transport protein